MANGTMTAPANVPRVDVSTAMKRVGDTSLSFGERLSSVGDVMRAASKQILAALPKHVTPERMIRVAMNCIRKNPKLLDCTPASLFAAMQALLRDGLAHRFDAAHQSPPFPN